jgi:succinate-semialdehyde dehydrogenase/glutarate-semialdehyde dehydrogenase
MKLKNKNILKTGAYINGEWIDSLSGKTFDVHNPFDNSVITQVADCTSKETKTAIEAAQTAFATWKEYSADERSRLLKKWYDLQMENIDDLATILTYEQGKPFEEAKGEIKYGASFVEWFAEEARRIYGDVIPGHQRNTRIVILKQPIGVVAAITPWNFPNSMITRKVAPALAAGCTVVLKPAKLTPLSANALVALAEEAGIPKGVINVIHSSKSSEIGAELTSNPIVKKLSFTGSTEVGKLLMAQCAPTMKKLSLELGGNAPFIVFKDADIDKAVQGAIDSKFRNAGQTCVCSNRLFVQAEIYDEFNVKFKKELAKLKLGNGMEKGVNIGPMIDLKAINFVDGMVSEAVEKGASIVSGGNKLEECCTIFEPTILSDVSSDMRVFKEEIFGPIAPVFKFETEEEVIKMANDTPFGLASYFYGNDNSQIWRVAEALEYGIVGINTGLISTTVAPFGGIKESGNGREGSKYGIEDYLEIKYLCMAI